MSITVVDLTQVLVQQRIFENLQISKQLYDYLLVVSEQIFVLPSHWQGFLQAAADVILEHTAS